MQSSSPAINQAALIDLYCDKSRLILTVQSGFSMFAIFYDLCFECTCIEVDNGWILDQF